MNQYVLLFLFQIILAVIMTVLINSFGSIKKGYVTLDNLLSTSNLGYNLLYRILSPVILISFVSVIFYELNAPFLVQNIWLISVYYFLFNFLALVLLNRFELVNKPLYFIVVASGIGISYWVYSSALQYGAQAILPDAGNFRTEWWFIVFAYLFNLFNDVTPDYNLEYKRKNNFLSRKLKNLKKRYNKFLTEDFKNDSLLSSIFYSIMITEDINRPKTVRIIERLLFWSRKVKTTGIMQVTSDTYLSDKQSIILSQKIILKSYQKYKDKEMDEYELVGKVAQDYNGGGYGDEISQNYYAIKNS